MRFQPGYLCHAPAQYIRGIRPRDGYAAPEDLPDAYVAMVCRAHPEWVTTRPKVRRALAWLELEFGR